MAILNSIAAGAEEMKTWRRHLHRHPELGLDCHETAGFVAAKLKAFGVDEIHEGFAKTGVVALIKGQKPGPVIGLRADMDALPILEAGPADHASTVEGRMHACGHDGHTTMLLGAAKYLAETRNFAGTVALIFQPGEETGNGARTMVAEGMLERFGIEQVFGLHTNPSAPVGTFATRAGPLLAAVDSFEIAITGRGGHGAYPEMAVDPVVAALQIGQALQTIVARNVASDDRAVLSVTTIQTGHAFNVIPQEARLAGTVRTHQAATRDMIERRMGEIVSGTGAAMGVEARLDYTREVDVTVNDAQAVAVAAGVAAEIVGTDRVATDISAHMGGEDFSFMLNARPGAFLLVGQGQGPALHNDKFDFNDEAAPYGASFFARLVETTMPL